MTPLATQTTGLWVLISSLLQRSHSSCTWKHTLVSVSYLQVLSVTVIYCQAQVLSVTMCGASGTTIYCHVSYCRVTSRHHSLHLEILASPAFLGGRQLLLQEGVAGTVADSEIKEKTFFVRIWHCARQQGRNKRIAKDHETTSSDGKGKNWDWNIKEHKWNPWRGLDKNPVLITHLSWMSSWWFLSWLDSSITTRMDRPPEYNIQVCVDYTEETSLFGIFDAL